MPFGLVISTDETKERYFEILKAFFETMQRAPDVVITDEAIAIKSALS